MLKVIISTLISVDIGIFIKGKKLKSLKDLLRELKANFRSLIQKDHKKNLKLNRVVRSSIVKCNSTRQKRMEDTITTDFLYSLKQQLKAKGEIFDNSIDEPFNGSDFFVCFQEVKKNTKREVFIHFQAKVLKHKNSYAFDGSKQSSILRDPYFFPKFFKYVLDKTGRNIILKKYSTLFDKIIAEELTQLETQYHFCRLNSGVLPLYLFYLDWKNYHSQNKLYHFSNVMFSFTEALIRKKAHTNKNLKLIDLREIVFDLNTNILSQKLLSQNGFFYFGLKLDLIFKYFETLRTYSINAESADSEAENLENMIEFKILENSNLLETLISEGHAVLKISV